MNPLDSHISAEDDQEKQELIRKNAPYNFDETPIIGGVDDRPDKEEEPSPLPKSQQISPESEFQVADVNMIQCPHCKRQFNEFAAMRHIPICENTRNRARPPPSKQQVMQQHLNRKSDQLKKPRNISVEVGPKIDSGKSKNKTNLQLQKIASTKDTLNQLVKSNIITELQKERESPFLRRESNKSFTSKGSFQSSPCRYISPLNRNLDGKGEKISIDGSAGGQSAHIRLRNSMNDLPIVPNTYNGKDKQLSSQGGSQ